MNVVNKYNKIEKINKIFDFVKTLSNQQKSKTKGTNKTWIKTNSINKIVIT